MLAVVHLVMRNHPLAKNHPLAADTLARLDEWSRNRRGSELEIRPRPHFSDVRVRFASPVMARAFLIRVQIAMPDVIGDIRNEPVTVSPSRKATERVRSFVKSLPLDLQSDLENTSDEELGAAAHIHDHERARVARRT